MVGGLKDPLGGPQGGILLRARIREVGPFEDWRASPAAGLGLPASVLARRVSAHYAERSDLHTRLQLARDVADAVQAQHILVACGIHRSDSGSLLQISHDPGGVDLGRSPVATARTPLPLAAAVWVGLQLYESLGHAHGLGAVHGNLSPAAVWIRADGEPVLDFGLAMSPKDPVRHDTEPLDLRWVHPEWQAADRFHPRGDVYALTAMLWWIMTGHAYSASPRRGPHRPLPSVLPEAPERLEAAFRYGLGRSSESLPSALRLAEAFSYVLYRDLAATDEAAVAAVRRWVADALGFEEAPSLMDAESVIGTFERGRSHLELGSELANAPTLATPSETPGSPSSDLTAGGTLGSPSSDLTAGESLGSPSSDLTAGETEPPSSVLTAGETLGPRASVLTAGETLVAKSSGPDSEGSAPTELPGTWRPPRVPSPTPSSPGPPLVTRAESDWSASLPTATPTQTVGPEGAAVTETRSAGPPVWWGWMFFAVGAGTAGALLWPWIHSP